MGNVIKLIGLIAINVFLISAIHYSLVIQNTASKSKTNRFISEIDILDTYFRKKMVQDMSEQLIDLSEALDRNGKRKSTDYIAIHHTGADESLVDVIDFHTKIQKWRSVGYHYYIDKSGTVYRLLKPNSTSAHAKHHNSDAVSVCMQGNFEEENPTAKQYEQCLKLIYILHVKYPDAEIVGHKDLSKTACPGRNFPLSYLINQVNHFHTFVLWKQKLKKFSQSFGRSN